MAENALDSLYFDYKLSGDPAYRPERVLDDGQHTYLIYPNDGRFRELPTLLMLVNGKTELVNFRVDGTRYIVDWLFDKAILVVGVGKKQTRVTITRATPYYFINIRRNGIRINKRTADEERKARAAAGAGLWVSTETAKGNISIHPACRGSDDKNRAS
jgi:Conjugal transfer protein